MKTNRLLIILSLCLLFLSGCSISERKSSIINRHAEALLTKNNELQFRFKINEKAFTNEKMYKVKVQIHNEKLASALGSDEIMYGSNEVYDGKVLNVTDDKDSFIYMEPIPLLLDLHVYEMEEMITDQQAVSVEIISNEETIAKAYLTHFTSQL